MSETDIQRTILAHYAKHPRVTLWRNNTGVAKTGGRFVRFGKVGSGDLTGLMDDGTRIEVEIKTPDGKHPQSAAQKEFQRTIEHFGGIYILATSLEDVTSVLDAWPIPDRQIPKEDFMLLFEQRYTFWGRKGETWVVSPHSKQAMSLEGAVDECRARVDKNNGGTNKAHHT